jgi:hypothetical protein
MSIFQATSPQAAHSGAASVSFQKSDDFPLLHTSDQQKGEDLGDDTVHQLHPNYP